MQITLTVCEIMANKVYINQNIQIRNQAPKSSKTGNILEVTPLSWLRKKPFHKEVYGEWGPPTLFTSCHTNADQELTICQSAFQVPSE